MASIDDIPVWRRMGVTPHFCGEDYSPVAIVGAGPVGLTLALDLGQRGVRVVVLNRLPFIAAGSKAICFAKRSLDIFDRLGVGDAMVAKGVVWDTGKVFWRNEPAPIYQMNLLPGKGERRPAFINLQQYHVESILVDALEALPNVEMRWGHDVLALDVEDDALAHVCTPYGEYSLRSDYMIACDGSRSAVRGFMGLDFEGRIFPDAFLIADIKMMGERPAERWFWFEPPFAGARSALLHKQPDDIWRLDFQLSGDIDRVACVLPENVAPFVRAMLGDKVEFEPEWYSVYTFQCRRMEHFVHGPVVFAGDSAHLVSPFGARGCNGGIADAENLGWKLAMVLNSDAPLSLLESYDHEASETADYNILQSTRSTDFMTPRGAGSRALRDAVLSLATRVEGMRPFVNSGRLSSAVHYSASPLSSVDMDNWSSDARPGTAAVDAPLEDGWLLARLGGAFVLLTHGWVGDIPEGATLLDVAEAEGGAAALCNLYDLTPGAAYLFRPDHYVAARWKVPDSRRVSAAIDRARGMPWAV
jgi:3-(3-hydroxy-phenyl)propionate hydroxylase